MADPKDAPLSRHRVLATRDVEEARHVVADMYLDHDLMARSAGPLDMTLNAVEGKHFTLGYLCYGAPTTLSMPPTGDSYHINLTTTGATRGSRSDDSRATTAAGSSGCVLRPDLATTVHWTPDAAQFVLKVSRASLESHLSDLLGRQVDSVVDFDFALDLSTPRGASLLSSVEFLTRELNRPGGLADMPLAREQLEAFVISQLIMTVPNSYRDELTGPVAPARVGRLKPVIEHIEANLAEGLTPQELAKVGSMSVRTLHETFKKAFDVSPMEYVRVKRLELVRAELLRNRDPQLRVTDLATSFGFFHLGRFAQQYRERYGETPSMTVRRHAAG